VPKRSFFALSPIIPAKRFQHLADESYEVVINLLPDESEPEQPWIQEEPF